MKTNSNKQSGFTIVELMIATMVFSAVLIIILAGVTYITKTYRKGINLENTQNTARNIMDSLAQSIQFSGGTISWPEPASPGDTVLSGRGCMGDQAYDFNLGYKVKSKTVTPSDLESSHALTFTPGITGCNAVAGSFTPGKTDLLGPNMRLSRLSIEKKTDDTYQIYVTVVYGDYDLLCSPSIASGSKGGCSNSSPSPDPDINFLTRPDLRCRVVTGNEFCAVSALSTIVQQRLVTN